MIGEIKILMNLNTVRDLGQISWMTWIDQSKTIGLIRYSLSLNPLKLKEAETTSLAHFAVRDSND